MNLWAPFQRPTWAVPGCIGGQRSLMGFVQDDDAVPEIPRDSTASCWVKMTRKYWYTSIIYTHHQSSLIIILSSLITILSPFMTISSSLIIIYSIHINHQEVSQKCEEYQNKSSLILSSGMLHGWYSSQKPEKTMLPNMFPNCIWICWAFLPILVISPPSPFSLSTRNVCWLNPKPAVISLWQNNICRLHPHFVSGVKHHVWFVAFPVSFVKCFGFLIPQFP